MGYCGMCMTKLIKKKGELYCPNCDCSVEDMVESLRYNNIWGDSFYEDEDEDEDDED